MGSAPCSLTQLSYEVKQHKACSQEVATAPGSLDVLSLFIPLEPHANAIFQEGADETQTRQVGQVLFGYPQELGDRRKEEDKLLTMRKDDLNYAEEKSKDVVSEVFLILLRTAKLRNNKAGSQSAL